jgi:hypothetical protein
VRNVKLKAKNYRARCKSEAGGWLGWGDLNWVPTFAGTRGARLPLRELRGLKHILRKRPSCSFAGGVDEGFGGGMLELSRLLTPNELSNQTIR